MAHIKGRGGKSGTRKYGRNKAKCERYRREGRREKNKARRKTKEAKRQSKFNVRREASKKDD